MATPRKIEIQTEIENGKFKENRDLILQAIETYEGKKVTVTLERYYKQRSNCQNAYYWAVIIEHWKNIIREEYSEIWTTQEMHEFLKTNFNSDVFVDESTGELLTNPVTNEVIRKPKSTSKNTTYSQEIYHEKCRQMASEMFNYLIPLPDNKLKAKF